MSAAHYVCPNCGEPISGNAKFCRQCGSDERTGWSDQTYLDGIDLPDSEEYDSLKAKEFGNARRAGVRISWRVVIAAVVLLAMAVIMVGSNLLR